MSLRRPSDESQSQFEFNKSAVWVQGLAQGHLMVGKEGGARAAFYFPTPDLNCWSGDLNRGPTGHKLTSLQAFRSPLPLRYGRKVV